MEDIEKWTTKNGIMLLIDDENTNISFFYISQADECLQVVLENRTQDFRIDIWSVETRNDEEVHHVFFVPSDEIIGWLSEIVRKINLWFSNRTPIN